LRPSSGLNYILNGRLVKKTCHLLSSEFKSCRYIKGNIVLGAIKCYLVASTGFCYIDEGLYDALTNSMPTMSRMNTYILYMGQPTGVEDELALIEDGPRPEKNPALISHPYLGMGTLIVNDLFELFS
jgi:hypothetical protein